MKITRLVLAVSVLIPTLMGATVMRDHIEAAKFQLKDIKRALIDFVDKQSDLTLQEHVQVFDYMIDKLDELIGEVKTSYDETHEKKYHSFLKILHILRKDAESIYQVISKKYFFFWTFVFALKRTFDKFKDESYRADLYRRLESLRGKLDEDEVDELDDIIGILHSIPEIAPHSKRETISILRAVWNR